MHLQRFQAIEQFFSYDCTAFLAAFYVNETDFSNQIRCLFTVIKGNKIFLVYKEIQMGSVAKSYMRKGFLMYEETHRYLVMYDEAFSHI
jgi:hypothetical protein